MKATYLRRAGALSALVLVLATPVAAMADTVNGQTSTSANASVAAQADTWLSLADQNTSAVNSSMMSSIWANDQANTDSYSNLSGSLGLDLSANAAANVTSSAQSQDNNAGYWWQTDSESGLMSSIMAGLSLNASADVNANSSISGNDSQGNGNSSSTDLNSNTNIGIGTILGISLG